MEQAVEQPVEGVVQQAVEGVVEQPVEGVVEQPVEGTVEQPVKSMVRQPVENTEEQPVEGTAEQPVEGMMEQAVEGVMEQAVEGVVEQLVRSTNISLQTDRAILQLHERGEITDTISSEACKNEDLITRSANYAMLLHPLHKDDSVAADTATAAIRELVSAESITNCMNKVETYGGNIEFSSNNDSLFSGGTTTSKENAILMVSGIVADNKYVCDELLRNSPEPEPMNSPCSNLNMFGKRRSSSLQFVPRIVQINHPKVLRNINAAPPINRSIAKNVDHKLNEVQRFSVSSSRSPDSKESFRSCSSSHLSKHLSTLCNEKASTGHKRKAVSVCDNGRNNLLHQSTTFKSQRPPPATASPALYIKAILSNG